MSNLSYLERLLIGLDRCGVKKYGRNLQVAEKTGYSPGMVAKVLAGHAALTDRFIQAVCAAFNIRKEWVYKGEEPKTVFGGVAEGIQDDTAKSAEKLLKALKQLRLSEMLRKMDLPEEMFSHIIDEVKKDVFDEDLSAEEKIDRIKESMQSFDIFLDEMLIKKNLKR